MRAFRPLTCENRPTNEKRPRPDAANVREFRGLTPGLEGLL